MKLQTYQQFNESDGDVTIQKCIDLIATDDKANQELGEMLLKSVFSEVEVKKYTDAEFGELMRLTNYDWRILIHKKSINIINLKTKITKIPAVIFKLHQLETIDLSNNNITKIPIDIQNLKNLRVLNLSYNNIIDIPVEIYNLPELTVLKLSRNSIKKIPTGISKLINVRELYLNSNEFKSIPDDITGMTNLRELILTDNPLAALPSTINDMKHISLLSIYNTKLNINDVNILKNQLKGCDIRYSAWNEKNRMKNI